jgi:hypothetical protein
MTYGFKFLNDNNETVIDDINVKPWYLRQAVVANATLVTSTYDRINDFYYTDSESGQTALMWRPYSAPGVTSWSVYEIRYEVPNDYDCFIAFSIPSGTGVYYNCPVPYSLKAAPTNISIFVFIPNTRVASVADIPKAYIFVTDPVPPPNPSIAKYGIRLFSESGAITYDSGYRHFQPVAIPTIFVPDPDNYVYTESSLIPDQQSTIPGNLANPVFLLPGIDLIKVGGMNWEEGTNVALVNSVVYGRSGSNLYLSVPRTKVQFVPSFTAAGFYNQALTGIQKYIVLDGNILDQGNSTPELETSYRLSRNKSAITEGQTGVIITLNTTAVPNGTIVPYTISGINANDLQVNDLTREFFVTNNTSNAYIEAVSDSFLEGTETVTLALDNGKDSITFTISDAITYSLSRSLTSPEEGQNILVYLTTGGIANGTLVPYTITGIQQSDLSFGSITGNFTVQNGAAELRFEFAKDTGNDYETMRISVNSGATFIDIPVTNIPYANEVLTITPNIITANQNTTVNITGGIAYDMFQFIILDVGINPVDTWNNRWKAEYASLVDTAYLDEIGQFNNPAPTGASFGIGNKTLWIFTNTSKNFRSANVTVGAEPTFSLTASNGTKGPVTLNEGQIGYFLVTTSNVPNGTVVYPKLVGPNSAVAADIVNSAQNGLTINNNTGSFTIEMVADQTTESDPEFNPTGQEFFNLVLDYPNGTRKDTYGMIYINDTSLTPATYNVTRSAASVNEGSAVIFTFTSNQSGVFYWTLTSGIVLADILRVEYYVDYGDGAYWESQGQINSGTIYPGGQVAIYFANDQTTEGPETPTFSVRTVSTSGSVVASQTVTINDTSLYPASGTPSGGPYCQGVNKYQNYHNGTGGTYASIIEANSLDCGYVPPATYNVARSAASVNEGSAVTFTFTTNQTGTFYWTLTGMDFADIWFVQYYVDYGDGAYWESQGQINSGVVYPGSQVQIYFTNDQMTEGAQTATFSVRSGSINGTVLASNSVTINDTSVYPAANTPSGGPYCQGVNKYQSYHNGSGGTYALLVESNSTFCGFNVWNESVTIVSDLNNNYIVPLNGYMTITIGQGEPNTGFTFAITNNGDAQPTSFPGTASLDGNGYFTNYITGATAQGSQTIGDKRLWVKFNYNQNVRSARFQVVYDSGTPNGGTFCSGFNLQQNYNNGSGGIYTQTVQSNSPTCGYVQQYYPYMSQTNYYYYNVDYVHDLWQIYDAKPNSQVKFTIVAGPAYIGSNATITTNGSGFGSYDIGNAPYAAGTYTINATFPGNDASYPTNYRTLVFYWIVVAGSGGGGGY